MCVRRYQILNRDIFDFDAVFFFRTVPTCTSIGPVWHGMRGSFVYNSEINTVIIIPPILVPMYCCTPTHVRAYILRFFSYESFVISLVLVYTRTAVVIVLLSARASGCACSEVSSVCTLLCNNLGMLDTFLVRLQYCSYVRSSN